MDGIALFDYMHCIMICKKGPGCTYVFRNCIFKESPLFGLLAGLLSYILFGKNIEKMIVNRIQIFVCISKIPHSENSHIKKYT